MFSGDSDQANAALADDSRIIAQLCDEFSERYKAGEGVTIESFASDYPEIRQTLQASLQAMQLLGALRVTDGEMPFEVQDTVAGCEILRIIGRGGMGVVYEASHPTVSRRLAIKVLSCTSGRPPQFKERLFREAEAASRLVHPNIVPFVDCGEHNGHSYISMLYVDGESLDKLLTSHFERDAGGNDLGRDLIATDFQRIAGIGADVASALTHAHARNTIHRDIKPGNLLLDRDGKIWVTDFGLAKLRDEDSDLSRTGDMIGTPRYMAPEQFRGISDERSDIYSLGITLYELAVGRRAWGEEKTPLQARKKGIELPNIQSINARVPNRLAQIIMRACAHAPDQRYQTAEELRQALRCFLTGKPFVEASKKAPARRTLTISSLVILVLVVVSALLSSPRKSSSRPVEKPKQYPESGNWVNSKSERANKTPVLGRIGPIEHRCHEGQTLIDGTHLTASDPDGDSFIWGLMDSADSQLFICHALSGRLAFRQPPSASAPLDMNQDSVYDLKMAATDRAGPHLAVIELADGGSFVTLRELNGESRVLQLPGQLQCASMIQAQHMLHTHRLNDGTVAVYESFISDDEVQTNLLTSDSHLPPFLRGLARDDSGVFVAIVESRDGFTLQRFTATEFSEFATVGDEIPLDFVTDPCGLSCLGPGDFQLVERSEKALRLWEVAISEFGIVGVRDLPVDWRTTGGDIRGLVAWTSVREDRLRIEPAICTVRLKVASPDETLP